MPKLALLIVCLLTLCSSAAFAGVTVTTPANNSTYQGSVLMWLRLRLRATRV